MEEKDLLLPLLAALWGCTNIVFSVTQELNKIRDKVITGQDGSQPLSASHREHLLENDWKPLAKCVILVCFGFTLIAGLSPLLLKSGSLLAWMITGATAAFSLLMGLSWIPAGRADVAKMKAAFEKQL